MKSRLMIIFALLAQGTFSVFAGSLRDPAVNRAVNDVRVATAAKGIHPAAAHEVIGVGAALITGIASRAELLFSNRVLGRAGAQTTLRFQPGASDLALESGTLLLETPPFSGSARVHAGSLTATTGHATFLIEHLLEKSVKIAVLEGEVRLSVDGFLGDSIVLTPGKLLITTPHVHRIPDAVDVNLSVLTRTSSLINPDLFEGSSKATAANLPHLPLIERQITRQDRLVRAKTLIPTNLVILGSGTTIVIPTEPTLQSSNEMEAQVASGKGETRARNPAEIAPPPQRDGPPSGRVSLISP